MAQESGSQSAAQSASPGSGSAALASSQLRRKRPKLQPPGAGSLEDSGSERRGPCCRPGWWGLCTCARIAATPLTEKDTIVLADFDNTTGDAVFDDTLKQALAVDLEQSPFLNVLSDSRMSETLRLMGRAPTDSVTQDVAQEICLRTGSKALLSGSIASLGNEYMVGLEAVGCESGDSLAKEQAAAATEEEARQSGWRR